ncbi:MAG: hypothetical protein Q4D19_00630 [Lautropia sp.]|nr:hypothetical protein [Lautropia sp.]
MSRHQSFLRPFFGLRVLPLLDTDEGRTPDQRHVRTCATDTSGALRADGPSLLARSTRLGAVLLASFLLASGLQAAPVERHIAFARTADRAAAKAVADAEADARGETEAGTETGADARMVPVPLPVPGQVKWPLTPSQLPEKMKEWLPWAMQGHEMLACPTEYANGDARTCLWPERLDLDIRGKTGSFRIEVSLYGMRSAVPLPGEAGSWPSQVRTQQGQTLPVVEQNGQPVVWLPPGRHTLTGQIEWTNAPQAVRVPSHGLTRITLNDESLAARTDDEGRIWLQRQADDDEDEVENRFEMRIRRLINDTIPRQVTTHYELNVAGESREMDLPAALLEGTRPAALRSELPARLHPDGRLQVQLRPGTWQIEVDALQMTQVETLGLPAGSQHAEVWSYQDHNDLHVTRILGVESVDPSQSQVPQEWQSLPAYEVSANSPMQIVPSTQGNEKPGANRLFLNRELWIDFDGKGMTQKDEIHGTLEDKWRLEQQLPTVLGYASASGTALPITRLNDQPPGVELRQKNANLTTLSRIEERQQAVRLNGWNTMLNEVEVRLNLPPGWMLLHASGMDSVQPPTPISRWNLYDLFFLLLTAIAGHYLLGWKRALILLPMLVVTWHELAIVRGIVQALLVATAIGRYLNDAHHRTWLKYGLVTAGVCCAVVILPYTLHEIRMMMHPTLEHHDYRSGQQPAGNYVPSPSVRSRAARKAAEPEAAAAIAHDAATPYSGSAKAAYSSILQQSMQENSGDVRRLAIQTGPGEPRWHWTQYRMRSSGNVLSEQPMSLTMLSVWPARIYKALRLALLFGGLYMLFSFVLRQSGGKGFAGPAGPKGSAGERASRRHPAASGGREPESSGEPADRPAPQSPTASGESTTTGKTTPAPEGVAAGGTTPAASKAPGQSLPMAALLLSGALLAGALLMPGTSQAADSAPDDATLQALRERLHPAPECTPYCAALGQMAVTSTRHELSLKLAIHTQAQVQVPLPSVDATDNWRLTQLLVNGKPAISRRDEANVLWVLMPPGVHVVDIRGQIGGGSNIRLSLPMSPQMLRVEGELWRAIGLQEGLPADNVLNLELHAPEVSNRPKKELTHVPDALPSFALVERTLSVQDRWQITTRINRHAESNAPVRVRFRLLAGESMNDGRVQVKNGIAEVHLGASESMTLQSTLTPNRNLSWHALQNPDQIEVWRLEPGAHWHATWNGINPIGLVNDGMFAPWWQPWPGEELTMTLVQPETVPGPTRTLESYQLHLKPGLHSTEAVATMEVRASLAGIQPMTLPAGAEFLSLTLDGEHVPLQARGREVGVPLAPGLRTLELRWREPRGTSDWAGRFAVEQLQTGLNGSNASTHLELRGDRVVLAAGGPILGPAVLFWSLFALLAAVAVVLGRYRLTPLGAMSWFVLLLGVAPSSFFSAMLLVGCFIGYSHMPRILKRFPAATDLPTASKVLMIALALMAGGVLWGSVQTALLGFPDMLITGNGSSVFNLHWYQDRFANQPEPAWAFSISLTTYRVLMLVWALWMAFATVRWLRWGIRHYIDMSATLPPPPSGPAGGGKVRKDGASAGSGSASGSGSHVSAGAGSGSGARADSGSGSGSGLDSGTGWSEGTAPRAVAAPAVQAASFPTPDKPAESAAAKADVDAAADAVNAGTISGARANRSVSTNGGTSLAPDMPAPDGAEDRSADGLSDMPATEEQSLAQKSLREEPQPQGGMPLHAQPPTAQPPAAAPKTSGLGKLIKVVLYTLVIILVVIGVLTVMNFGAVFL